MARWTAVIGGPEAADGSTRILSSDPQERDFRMGIRAVAEMIVVLGPIRPLPARRLARRRIVRSSAAARSFAKAMKVRETGHE